MQVLCTITPFTLYQWRERVRRNHAVLMDSFKFHENNVSREQKAPVKSLQLFKEYLHINHWKLWYMTPERHMLAAPSRLAVDLQSRL